MQAALATAPKTADRKHGRGGKGWGRLRPGGRARSEKDHAWEQIQRRQQHRKAMQQHRKTTPPTRLPRAARPSATRSHASDRAGCGLSGALLVRLARSTCVCALLPPPPPSLPLPPRCSPRQALAGKADPAEDDDEEEEEIAPARPAATNAFSAFALLGRQHLC